MNATDNTSNVIAISTPAAEPKFCVGREFNTVNVPMDKLQIAAVRLVGQRWEYEIRRGGRHWAFRSEEALELEMFPEANADDVIVAPGMLASGWLIRIGPNVYNARFLADLGEIVVSVDPFSNAGKKSAYFTHIREKAEQASHAHHKMLTSLGYGPNDEVNMKPYISRGWSLSLAA